jgi:hypothetical protein
MGIRWLENKFFVVRFNVTGVKIPYVEKIVIIGHGHCHAFVNRAGRAPVPRSKGMRVIEIRIPPRNHSVFAYENELGGKHVRPVADAKERRVVPDGIRGICAFGVSCARRNSDDKWIFKARCGRAILKILGRNSSSVINDKYRSPIRAGHAPGVYDTRISELGDAMDIRLEVFPVEASRFGTRISIPTGCASEPISSMVIQHPLQRSFRSVRKRGA